MRALVSLCLCAALAACACTPGRQASAAPAAAPTAGLTHPPGQAAATPHIAATATPARPTESAPTPTSVSAPQPTASPTRTVPVLDGLLDSIVPESGATYALVLEDLASGTRTQVNSDQSLPSASLYKLGVAWAVLREVQAGRLSLDMPIEVEDEDAIEPEPDGGFGTGDAPQLHEAITTMLSVSSNAAAHALLRTIGRDAFTQEMDRIGLHQTRVPDNSVAVTSADDMARLLRLIATSTDLNEQARSLMAQGMSNVVPPDALRDSLPSSLGIYQKTGNLDDASNVGALLVTPRATAILVVIDSGANPGDARAVIAQAGQIAYRTLLQ